MKNRTSASELTVSSVYAWALIAVLASSFMALFFSLQAGVFLVLFIAVAWWAWREPEDAFLLLLILSPLFLMLKITQTIGTATLIKDVLIITLFIRLFAMPFLRQKLPYRRNVLFSPILGLGAWTLLMLLRADVLILGILRARDIGLYVLLYFAVLFLPQTVAVQLRRIRWLTISLFVVLILGVFQWFFAVDSAVLRFDPMRQVWIPRLSSLFAHPSIFGHYLVTAAALCGAILIAGRGRVRLLAGVLGISLLPFIYVTYSRAVWLGLAAAGATMGAAWLWWLARQRVRIRWLAAGAAVAAIAAATVLAGLIIFTPVGIFLRSAFDPTYGSNEERLDFAARLIAPMTPAEALTGRGLGDVLTQNFREVSVGAIDLAAGSSRTVKVAKDQTLVDNQWLKTFVEMGLAGLLLYSWLFWRVGANALRLLLRTPAGGAAIPRIIGLWGIGFLTAFVLQGFFIDVWDVYPTNMFFWIIAALVSAVQTPISDSSTIA